MRKVIQMVKKGKTIGDLNSGWAFLLRAMLILLPLDIAYRVWVIEKLTSLTEQCEAKSEQVNKLSDKTEDNVARIEKIERKLLIP